jgi:hypothetical protein
MNKLFLLALSIACFSAAAFADGQFTNSGGTITSRAGSTGYYLILTGSSLVNVSGAGSLDCSGAGAGGCNGRVSYTTGFTSGLNASLINNVGGSPTNLGAGGLFTISGDNGTGPHGDIFKGTFTNATWTYVGTCTGTTSCGVAGGYYEWEITGNVTGTYYINGQQIQGAGATIQLTTQKMTNDPFTHGTGTIGLSGGSSTVGRVTAPESGTLILFGTGLVGIALLARRKFSSGIRT